MRSAATAPTANDNDLYYFGLDLGDGSTFGGVQSSHPRVYVVFYGSQWGSAGTDGSGYVTLSGDSVGMAPVLQKLFKGLGTNGELYSGVLTQYCENIEYGLQTCPPGGKHVVYPTGGVLSGVWADGSIASPTHATGQDLAREAIKAAGHFGNTTDAGNRDSQYIIVSPTGTHPDGFNTPSDQFCAWHDDNNDFLLSGGGGVSSPYGTVAFTNLPYVTDLGKSCGQGFINQPGLLDGVSIVSGHEYAETVTDPNPGWGWVARNGEENADKCIWIAPDTPGGGFNLPLTTGTFAMQATWSNDIGGCQASHPVVTG
ncbi:MAG TPA: hypothetical protein VJT31_24690 [Rugosimonospora sp.]|nr:hypothetical protein [Rugosimonospora sp.]